MELVYSSHAVERMQQRNLSIQDVEDIIFKSEGKLKQSKDKLIYYKKLKGRKDNLVAAVVVEKNPNFMEVVTVMVNFEVKK